MYRPAMDDMLLFTFRTLPAMDDMLLFTFRTLQKSDPSIKTYPLIFYFEI